MFLIYVTLSNCIFQGINHLNPGIDLPFLDAFFNLFCFLSCFRFFIFSVRLSCFIFLLFSSASTRDSHFFFECFFFLSILLIVFFKSPSSSFTLTPSVLSMTEFHVAFSSRLFPFSLLIEEIVFFLCVFEFFLMQL